MNAIGMSEIIEQLEKWKKSILIDISQENVWETPEQKRFIQREQFRKLDEALMILKSIGYNENINA